MVRAQRARGVVRLTIESPPFNILTIAILREMASLLRVVQEDDRVVMIRGSGDNFSSGVDVAEHLPGKGEEMLSVLEDLYSTLHNLPVPAIGAVRGVCLGGGLELAAACDFMVVSETAKLGSPEIKLGVVAPVAVARLARRIGAGKAAELLLTGKTMDGREAERIGLATFACPEHEVNNRADELAQRLASFSPRALRSVKRTLRETEGVPYAEALRRALAVYREEVLHSPDAIEGLTAFLEKREPRWGRTT